MGMRTVEPNGWTLASDDEDDWLSWLEIPIGNNGFRGNKGFSQLWLNLGEVKNFDQLSLKDRYILTFGGRRIHNLENIFNTNMCP